MPEQNNNPQFPLESALITTRRALWRAGEQGADRPAVGLALSGGGIRSATFSLGLVQSLADRSVDRLHQLDYLSTVSGGGYAGSFIGSLFLPRRADLSVPDPQRGQSPDESAAEAASRAQRLLAEPPHLTTATVEVGAAAAQRVFHPLRWLRENGRYLTPSGTADMLYMLAFYLRSLNGVHCVLGLALFGLALAIYSARIAVDAASSSASFAAFDWARYLAPEAPRLWASPLWVLPLIVLAAVAAPLVFAYWTIYRQQAAGRRTAEEWSVEAGPWLLTIVAMLFTLVLRIGQPESWLGNATAFAAYLGAIAIVLRDLVLTRLLTGSMTRRHWQIDGGQVARARQLLTRWLTVALQVALAAAALALIDTLGQSLFVGVLRGQWLMWGSGGAGVAAAVVLIRRVGAAVLGKDAADWLKWLANYRKLAALIAGVAALLVLAALYAAALQSIVWSAVLPAWLADPSLVHAAAGAAHNRMLLAAWLIWAVAFPLMMLSAGFLNTSTFHRFYAARLVRTFLGAANLVRQRGFCNAMEQGDEDKARKLFVSVAHADDDLPLRAYYGGRGAGPLHLINVTLNESVSRTSNLQRDDRKGVAMCIGPVGIGVGDSFWAWGRSDTSDIGYRLDVPQTEDAEEADDILTRAAALLAPNRTVERLSLGSWAAISGAAMSTGLGALSSTGFSLMAWLVNARLAYWWQPSQTMSGFDSHGAAFPNAYRLMWQEITGGFVGRPDRYWNLSDGGHFENTAVYELVRRRVPLIFCADNGADPDYDFPDLQNLARLVRIDFGAELDVLDEHELPAFVDRWLPEQPREHVPFGALADFKDPASRARRCALLAWIRHPADATSPQRRSLLVLVKPTVAADTAVDVRLYARDQPAFPQQSTGDQFFDEAQWESYRRLGFDAGRRVFAHWDRLLEAAAEAANPPPLP